MGSKRVRNSVWPPRTIGVNGVVMGFGLLVIGLVLVWGYTKSQGLEASYWLKNEQGKILVARQIDRQINFATQNGLRGPYYRNWQIEKHGFPTEEVLPLVEWKGWVRTRQAGYWRLVANQQSWWKLGNERHEEGEVVEVGAGVTPIEISYESDANDTRIVLEVVDGSSGEGKPVDPTWLYPNEAQIMIRQGMVFGLAGLMVSVMVLGWWGWKSPRVKLLMQGGRKVDVLLLGAVMLLIMGLGLRLYQYDSIPPLHETEDEQGLAWHGISLILDGTPTSWLFYDYFHPEQLYPSSQLQSLHWFGANFTLGTPYFDNPPFMPILLGIVSVVLGATSIFESKLIIIRLIPIIAGTVNIYLIYLWGKQILKKPSVGLLAGFFYTFTPLIVVANRLVKEENLLATFFLLTGLALHSFIKSRCHKDLYSTAILCGLAFLTKETSVVLIFSVLTMFYRFRLPLQYYFRFLLAFFPFVVFYFVYGIPWGWEYVWISFQLNSQKILDAVSWLRLILNRYGAAINPFAFFFYPLLIIHWFMAQARLDKFSQLTVIGYFVLMGALIYGTDWGFFGWYKTAIYPFLCLGIGTTAASVFNSTLKSNHISRFAFVFFTLIAGLFYPLNLYGLAQHQLVLYSLAGVTLIYSFFPQFDSLLKHTPSYLLLFMFAVGSTITILNQEILYFLSLSL